MRPWDEFFPFRLPLKPTIPRYEIICISQQTGTVQNDRFPLDFSGHYTGRLLTGYLLSKCVFLTVWARDTYCLIILTDLKRLITMLADKYFSNDFFHVSIS